MDSVPLPIDAALPELTAALRANNAAVLVAPPGAGKTTRVPLVLAAEQWAQQADRPGRILVLENMLRNAVIIEEGADNGVIGVGSVVEVKDEFGKQSFTIVGPAEVDVAGGRISMESPVGKALMGHKVGDEVEVISPGGTRRLKITKIN